MFVRTALFLAVSASSAQAAPFQDLKDDLASCLRFEMGASGPQRGGPIASGSRAAVERCSVEMDRLDRADGRRLRGDGGLSPSTKEVIQGALGRSEGMRSVGLRY